MGHRCRSRCRNPASIFHLAAVTRLTTSRTATDRSCAYCPYRWTSIDEGKIGPLRIAGKWPSPKTTTCNPNPGPLMRRPYHCSSPYRGGNNLRVFFF